MESSPLHLAADLQAPEAFETCHVDPCLSGWLHLSCLAPGCELGETDVSSRGLISALLRSNPFSEPHETDVDLMTCWRKMGMDGCSTYRVSCEIRSCVGVSKVQVSSMLSVDKSNGLETQHSKTKYNTSRLIL